MRGLHEQVLEELQKHIASAHMAPGDRFPPERELAARLGVSRPILRSAFRVLEAMGLTEARQGGGRYLRRAPNTVTLTSDDVLIALKKSSLLDIYEVRMDLETQIVRLAAMRSTAEDVAKLEAIYRQSIATDYGEVWAVMDLDLDFHIALADCTHNFAYRELIKVLMEALKQIRQKRILGVKSWRQLNADHEGIIEAISSRNPSLAHARMLAHLERIRATVLRRPITQEEENGSE